MEGAGQMSKHNSPDLEDKPLERVYAPKPKSKTIKVAIGIDARMKVTGKYSGQEYLFSGAGSVQNVEEIDVEWLLSKRQGGRQCCGGGEDGNIIFRLVEK